MNTLAARRWWLVNRFTLTVIAEGLGICLAFGACIFLATAGQP